MPLTDEQIKQNLDAHRIQMECERDGKPFRWRVAEPGRSSIVWYLSTEMLPRWESGLCYEVEPIPPETPERVYGFVNVYAFHSGGFCHSTDEANELAEPGRIRTAHLVELRDGESIEGMAAVVAAIQEEAVDKMFEDPYWNYNFTKSGVGLVLKHLRQVYAYAATKEASE